MSRPVNLTPVQKRILLFFQQQPQAIETARGISAFVTEEAQVIQQALDQLLEWKWLTAHESSAVKGYALTRDKRLLAQLKEALEQ